ncbi:MAG: carboxypeptidase regulatory-like domain-containing protein [Caldilineaceae bacterium]
MSVIPRLFCPALQGNGPGRAVSLACLCLLLALTACAPTPEANVIGYLIAERLGSLEPAEPATPRGALTGQVLHDGQPVPHATVIVAERTGLPHVAQTDEQGRYTLTHIPRGQYVPAAVAPGFVESTLRDRWGQPNLVTIRAGSTTVAPPLILQRHVVSPLPVNLAQRVDLHLTARTEITAAFPANARAKEEAFRFVYAGATVDTLRLYRTPAAQPTTTSAAADLPLLFMVYPTHVDLWQSVSVALAAEGFTVVAISPLTVRGVDIDAHAADARVALALAQQGALDPALQGRRAVALGGSFSSAILHRLIQQVDGDIVGWVTVGGISNAFTGAAEFYAGKLAIPPQYKYLIPALGSPSLYPLAFLRFSPVYTAAQLPPTMIIHTAADHVIPIAQAYELEDALKAAGVPVQVFYYADVSHYLQIDDQMTDAGREMFYRIVDFAREW